MIKANNFKRILTATVVTLLAVLCTAVVVACGRSDSSLQKLPTPDKPEKNGGIVTWNNDPLYTDFVVSVDGTEYKTTENSFDIKFAVREGKAFDVKVKAVGDGKYYADSDWSEALTVAPMSLTMELIESKDEYKIAKCNKASGDIVLPQTYNNLLVTDIGISAFEGCKDITSVTIPQGITCISTAAFQECENLERVIIPDTVETIAPHAFAWCEKLKEIHIPKSVSYINGNIFQRSGIANLTVDADNEYYRAEGNCLIRRRDNTLMFANENSTIPSDVDTIEIRSIYTDNIEVLTIPNGVKKLERLFVWSLNLKRVEIPASVEEIEREAFTYIGDATELTVAEDNPVYKSDCGHIIRKSDNVLMFGCSGNVVIPDYVTGIADRAFYGHNTQKELFIPKSVTWIGNECFDFCKKLEYVYLPDMLKELGSIAFFMEIDSKGYYKWGVRSVTVPEGCVFDKQGPMTYSAPDCEIGYDDGYAYAISIVLRYSEFNAKYGIIKKIVEYDPNIEYDGLPYRYGYTLGGFSATPDGEKITTVEEIEQLVFTEDRIQKVRVYPIWIANE